jgi:hypothetical protein
MLSGDLQSPHEFTPSRDGLPQVQTQSILRDPDREDYPDEDEEESEELPFRMFGNRF